MWTLERAFCTILESSITVLFGVCNAILWLNCYHHMSRSMAKMSKEGKAPYMVGYSRAMRGYMLHPSAGTRLANSDGNQGAHASLVSVSHVQLARSGFPALHVRGPSR